MAVTFSTAKEQLNITTSDDDALLVRLVQAAQNWLERQLGYTLLSRYPIDVSDPQLPVSTIPPALDHAVLLLVGHFYANREASVIGVVAGELPLGVCDIVNDYRDWSWGEADA
jgi:hypothetical protein